MWVRSGRSALVVLMVAACSGGGTKAHPADATPDVPPGCGDGVKAAAEQCDGSDLGSATCGTATAPGWVGVVSCTSLCQLNIAGCNPPTTNWSTLTTASNWTAFDVSTLFAGAKGFASSVFDGRYMYFMPSNNAAPDGLAARYDTRGGFGASGSWETFDISTVNAAAKGFIGGAFDGRYIYFIPYNNGTTYDGTMARFDTQDAGGFGAPSAWATFDIATVNANARGFVSGAFDGRYLYLAPHYNGAYDGVTARYDTHASFTDAASWEVFDASTVNASAKGFLGAAFDGRYVYYAPYYNGTAYHGVLLRFDTQASGGYIDKASWSAYNLGASLNANAVGFYSIAFDGQYIYLGQYYDGGAAVPGYGGYMVRYDTTASFTTNTSYALFNAASINANAQGYVGAAFDGRYVFFAPYYDGTNYSGEVVRYDTQGAGFTSAGAWSAYNTTAVNANAKGFHGVGFDGQYMYFVPSATAASTPGGVIARFNAKTPAWLPLGWNAAFD